MEIVAKLKAAIPSIDGIPVEIYTESEHRFVVVFRAPEGQPLGANISDVDPQVTGVEPKTAVSGDPSSERTAALVNGFVARAEAALKDEPQVTVGVSFIGCPDFSKLLEYRTKQAFLSNASPHVPTSHPKLQLGPTSGREHSRG